MTPDDPMTRTTTGSPMRSAPPTEPTPRPARRPRRAVRPAVAAGLLAVYDSCDSYDSCNSGSERDLTADVGRRPELHGHSDSAAQADRAAAHDAGAVRLG
jgi:hypothetical protein